MAISVDSPEDSENLRRSQGYTFPILSDAQEDVIRRWDLVHLHGRRDGGDISRPAEFLIDPSGKVRWVNLTEDFVVRARPKEALAAFQTLSKLEGIIPALESAHAVAHAIKIGRELTRDDLMIVNLSGRGDKDVDTVKASLRAEA